MRVQQPTSTDVHYPKPDPRPPTPPPGVPMSISFKPARGTVLLCPVCLGKENVRHPIEFFDLLPHWVTTEGDVILSFAVCHRIRIVILKSPSGWFSQDPARSADAEFLGPQEEDDDADTERFN